jgi:hypothetical protein
MKYRKKPVVIEAIQFRNGNFSEIMAAWPEAKEWKGWMTDGKKWNCGIPTLEGTMTASDGDWIIKGVKGEYYPCKPDIFEMTYEPEDISSANVSDDRQLPGQNATKTKKDRSG